ncbi:uncharacterized protein LOC134540179 isoform X2 [Bacillus rossius redtenbacheri]|uniref:uncharacterized protein LOC134540179 isoform X2 n=1 Tax=Bacillus rossius redtenbacheri TaxID=93214 RepID=UPI002FDE95D6
MLAKEMIWWITWSLWVGYMGIMIILAMVLVQEGVLMAWRSWTGRTITPVSSVDGSSTASQPAATDVLRTSSQVVTVRVMPRGGDSLFEAVSHQLRCAGTGAAASPRELRDWVARHVAEHLPQYRAQVLGSVGERYPGVGAQAAQVLRYLRDLRLPGFPPGGETLQAVADVLGVDVDVFPEGGARETVCSRQKDVATSLGLARRMLEDEEGVPRVHYDSVLTVTGAEDSQARQYSQDEDMAQDECSLLNTAFLSS